MTGKSLGDPFLAGTGGTFTAQELAMSWCFGLLQICCTCFFVIAALLYWNSLLLELSIITPGCVRGFVRPSVRACVRTCEKRKRKPHARAPGCTFDL